MISLPLSRPRGTAATQIKLWLLILCAIFCAVGLIAKSFIFIGGEPVAVHYFVNAIIIGLAGLAYVLGSKSKFAVGPGVPALIAFAIAWSALSAFTSQIGLNYVAVISFTLLVVGAFIAFPSLLQRAGMEPWRLLLIVMAVPTVLSAIMFVITPDLATDAASGRFSGAFVSVAVACNIFFLVSVFALRASLIGKSAYAIFGFGSLSALSLVLLFLTKTRSSLLECLFCIGLLLVFSPLKRGMKLITLGLAGLGLLFVAGSGFAVSTGVVAVDQQLDDFRLVETDLTDARDGNWLFGIERIQNTPWTGEGLLSKQTQGGTRGVDFDSETSYDPRYDPHSLVLSLGVQGGVPFALAIFAIIGISFGRFIQAFGWRKAMEAPEFVVGGVHLVIMTIAGGDLTSLGNPVDKFYWLLIGTMALKAEMVLRNAPQSRTVKP